MGHKILIVDDQVSFCNHILTILENEGYEVVVAHDSSQAMNRLSTHSFDILLTDMKMPGVDGLELFQNVRKIDPHISGVIMTAYGTISSAVNAIKQGVTDYIQKPFEPEAMLMVIEKTIRERSMLQEIRNLRKEVNQRYAFGNIIGKNHKMQIVYDLIQKVASTDARVFITGETGVGKELVAKAIHFNSSRKNRPFVGINCGALSETLLEAELFGYEKGAFTGANRTKIGKFEYAQGGTIFLDEVGDISPRMQVQLLRVLQEKKFERVGGNRSIDLDVKIISATNQDINDKVKQGEYRVELFYRLSVVPIHIPSLRERIEDIPLLLKHFISILNKNFNRNIKEITAQAMTKLIQHTWPGNVRELENVLERAFVTTEGDTISAVHFSGTMTGATMEESPYYVNIDIPFKVACSIVEKRFEKAYIYESLKRYE
ncbi:MAG TPA: sigma-54-dependent Fis family transcriptional regulator, partial [Deltaproteobacteria bacterium]|nr:sigma-54-dependent Fis family transcriptional regulator [Deltaproteobacteria bacterium]